MFEIHCIIFSINSLNQSKELTLLRPNNEFGSPLLMKIYKIKMDECCQGIMSDTH